MLCFKVLVCSAFIAVVTGFPLDQVLEEKSSNSNVLDLGDAISSLLEEEPAPPTEKTTVETLDTSDLFNGKLSIKVEYADVLDALNRGGNAEVFPLFANFEDLDSEDTDVLDSEEEISDDDSMSVFTTLLQYMDDMITSLGEKSLARLDNDGNNTQNASASAVFDTEILDGDSGVEEGEALAENASDPAPEETAMNTLLGNLWLDFQSALKEEKEKEQQSASNCEMMETVIMISLVALTGALVLIYFYRRWRCELQMQRSSQFFNSTFNNKCDLLKARRSSVDNNTDLRV